jgi:hypothetical protein
VLAVGASTVPDLGSQLYMRSWRLACCQALAAPTGAPESLDTACPVGSWSQVVAVREADGQQTGGNRSQNKVRKQEPWPVGDALVHDDALEAHANDAPKSQLYTLNGTCR